MRRPLLDVMILRPSPFVLDNGWSGWNRSGAKYIDEMFIISEIFLTADIDDVNVGFFPVCTV